MDPTPVKTSRPMRASGLVFSVALLLLSLSGGAAAASDSDRPGAARQESRDTTSDGGAPNALLSSKCKPDLLHRSLCMIALILEDIEANYDHVGGGGVSSIEQVSSTSYRISLPQEERIDFLTYEFAVDSDGRVTLQNKIASTKSF